MQGSATVLSPYAIRGDAGGKVAQLGSRLLGSVARKIADRFFTNIAEAAAKQDVLLKIPKARSAIIDRMIKNLDLPSKSVILSVTGHKRQ